MTETLFRDDSYLKSCEATVTSVGTEGLRLDRTVFYAESGGQPGDSGILAWDGGSARVVDTRKGDGPDDILHILDPNTSPPPPGSRVTATIDWERRHRHMRIHTCMHLLCSLVDGEVTGGQIGDGKGRIDFNVPGEALDKQALAEALNRLVAEDHPVRARWVTDEELAADPNLVRTMSVRPPSGSGRVRLLEVEGVDLQACGGTHVARTGEIGRIELGKIENKGRQNRRVNFRFAES